MTGAAREGDIPFGDVPGRWAEVAERADRHERLRLVRGEGTPALVVMTEDDFDQAVEDAADLALCRDILDRMKDDPRPTLFGDDAMTFLKEIADQA